MKDTERRASLLLIDKAGSAAHAATCAGQCRYRAICVDDMCTSRQFKTVLSVLTCVTLAGCGDARRSEPITGAIALADPVLQRGRLLYDRWCYKCHTEGEGGMAPVLNDKPLPKFMIKLQTRVGMGAMPGFSEEQINAEELEAIAAYVVALRHSR
jgi:mono/diheme cytochrome c family protein